jgi:hypothetical protein
MKVLSDLLTNTINLLRCITCITGVEDAYSQTFTEAGGKAE